MENLVNKLSDKTLEQFTAELSDPENIRGAGPAAAYSAAMGISLAMKACGHEEGLDKVRETLDVIRGYCMKMAVEDTNALRGLFKVMNNADPNPDHLEAALRIACQPPTEVMYAAGRSIELYKEIAEKCSKEALVSVTAGTEMCRGAMLAAEQIILENAASMLDDVFAMTLRIEGKKVMEQYFPLADSALKTAAERLEN